MVVRSTQRLTRGLHQRRHATFQVKTICGRISICLRICDGRVDAGVNMNCMGPSSLDEISLFFLKGFAETVTGLCCKGGVDEFHF